MEKKNNCLKIIRRVCMVIAIISLVFTFLTSLFLNYQSLSWNFSLFYGNSTMNSAHLLVPISQMDWFIARPLMMLCLGFCVIAVPSTAESRSFHFKYDYVVYFLLALVAIILCASVSYYGLKSSVPPFGSIADFLGKSEWLRVTMMLIAGMLLGRGACSLGQGNPK